MNVNHHSFRARSRDRLDRLLTVELSKFSRSHAKKLIEEGRVSVNSTVTTKAGAIVDADTAVTVVLPTASDFDALGRDVPLNIVFEDEETLVIDKPAGILVHPAPGISNVTLIDAVRARYPEVREIDDGERPGIVHRLDRDTSGVMVFAKTAPAVSMLKDQWRARETLKIYVALVDGHIEPSEGIVDAPLGPDPANPRRRAVVEDGQSARTQYKLIEQYGDAAALVEIRIFTGRTHQIRVHMSAIGNPVTGDLVYGHSSELITRQALHAHRLGFTLASTGEWREFEAPMANDLQQAIGRLRNRHHTENRFRRTIPTPMQNSLASEDPQ